MNPDQTPAELREQLKPLIQGISADDNAKFFPNAYVDKLEQLFNQQLTARLQTILDMELPAIACDGPDALVLASDVKAAIQAQMPGGE
jgi:hypothetical protein